jgi:hypothetical protein
VIFAGDVPDVGGEVAQDGAEAGGQEAGAGEDGHLSPVIRNQGHFSILLLIQPLLLLRGLIQILDSTKFSFEDVWRCHIQYLHYVYTIPLNSVKIETG